VFGIEDLLHALWRWTSQFDLSDSQRELGCLQLIELRIEDVLVPADTPDQLFAHARATYQVDVLPECFDHRAVIADSLELAPDVSRHP
jgi:hypothetical protein